MRTTLPYDGMSVHTDPVHATDLLVEVYAEYELQELSLAVGVDLLMFEPHVLGETPEARAAREAARADMIAADPEILKRVERCAAELRRRTEPAAVLLATNARLAGLTAPAPARIARETAIRPGQGEAA